MALYAVLFALTATAALPLGPSGGSDVSVYHELSVRADGSTPSTRTLFGIVWGCLTTIFACTWLAIHPNVPNPEDSRRKILLRKIMIMVLAIVFPEYTTVWAIRQWRAAKDVSRVMSRNKIMFPEWTITHSFFLVMWGFTIVDKEGKPQGPLRSLSKVLSLREQWGTGLKLPSEREILDHSKGDALSKTLILLHTSWFLLQVLSRPISGLPITELELITIAFASLNIIAYAFWYHKPLNVECPIQVWTTGSQVESLGSSICLHSSVSTRFPEVPYMETCDPTGSKEDHRDSIDLEAHTSDITDAFEEGLRPSSPSGWMEFNRSNSQIPLPPVTNSSPQVKCAAVSTEDLAVNELRCKVDDTSSIDAWDISFDDNFNPMIPVLEMLSFPLEPQTFGEVLRPSSPPGWMKFDQSKFQISVPDAEDPMGDASRYKLHPPVTLLSNSQKEAPCPPELEEVGGVEALSLGPYPSTLSQWTKCAITQVPLGIVAFIWDLMQRAFKVARGWQPWSSFHYRESIFFRYTQKIMTTGMNPASRSGPTFHCGSSQEEVLISTSGLLQLLIAMYFGAIHCAAWNFIFPTRGLCWLWRISAIILTSVPVYFMMLSTGIKVYHDNNQMIQKHRLEFQGQLPSFVRKVTYWSGISFLMWAYYKICPNCVLRVLHPLLVFLYLVARITLIILPFILLQGYLQAPRTLEEIEWTKYIPHVSWIFS